MAALALLAPSAIAVTSAHADDGMSGAGTTIGPSAPAQAIGPDASTVHHIAADPSSPEGYRLVAPSEAATPAEGRIIGGTGITPAQAPWTVFLYSQNPATNYETTCTGAILNAIVVVTAAHCLTGVTVGNPGTNLGLAVVAGLQNYKSLATGQTRTAVAQGTSTHPGWKGDINSSSGGDIALVTLDKALDFNASVRPIALPPPSGSVNGDPIVPPTSAVLEAGYGDQDTAGNADGTIHQLAASIVDPDVCAAFAESGPTLCTQSPAGTPCHGDSGSALVSTGPTPYILGVVSGGALGACAAGAGVAYTSILAPENRAYVDGTAITYAPRQTDFTRWKTSSSFQTGTVLTCFGDNWSNGATVKWIVSNEAGTIVGSGLGASFNYTFAQTDVGHVLSCRSYGSNAGGVGVSDRVVLPQAIAQGPAVPVSPTPGGGAASPQAADGDGMHVAGPKATGRGHTAKFKISFDTVPAGSNRIRVTVTIKSKHGTSTSKVYRIPAGSTSGSVTMKLRLSKNLATGTKTVHVTATTYFGTKKNGTPRKLSVKLKVKAR